LTISIDYIPKHRLEIIHPCQGTDGLFKKCHWLKMVLHQKKWQQSSHEMEDFEEIETEEVTIMKSCLHL
jgi:hypothetical protein